MLYALHTRTTTANTYPNHSGNSWRRAWWRYTQANVDTHNQRITRWNVASKLENNVTLHNIEVVGAIVQYGYTATAMARHSTWTKNLRFRKLSVLQYNSGTAIPTDTLRHTAKGRKGARSGGGWLDGWNDTEHWAQSVDKKRQRINFELAFWPVLIAHFGLAVLPFRKAIDSNSTIRIFNFRKFQMTVDGCRSPFPYLGFPTQIHIIPSLRVTASFLYLVAHTPAHRQ